MNKLTALDEQLAALAPLQPKAIATLLGYSSQQALTNLRAKGRTIPPERMAALAERLRRIADRITPPSS
jgi:hypothetical protein